MALIPTKTSRYRELRDVVYRAKADAASYGTDGGGLNPYQFLMRPHLMDDYARIYYKAVDNRLAKLGEDEAQELSYRAYYYKLEPEERAAEQVKMLRWELAQASGTGKAFQDINAKVRSLNL
jgi:hypothetical protein